jgi:hypothetical protein
MFSIASWSDRIRVPPAVLPPPPGSAAAAAAAQPSQPSQHAAAGSNAIVAFSSSSAGGGGVSACVLEFLEREIDATYGNRVLPGVGLVISCWAVDDVREAFIQPGDGGALPTGAWRGKGRGIWECCWLSDGGGIGRRAMAHHFSTAPPPHPPPPSPQCRSACWCSARGAATW